MKRHMRLSLVLVALVLTLSMLLAGCGETEELQAQIDENATKADTGIKNADSAIKDAQSAIDAVEKTVAENAKAATEDLTAAVNELKDIITAGDKVDADALAAAIADFEAAVEAAEKKADDADKALKEAIELTIAAKTKEVADAAKASLDAAVAELKAADTDTTTKIGELSDKIDAVSTLANSLSAGTSNYYTKVAVDELLDAINESVTAVVDAIQADKDAWNNATDAIVEALDEIWAEMEGYVADEALYTTENFENIEHAYNKAYVIIFRALDADAAVDAKEEFIAYAASVETIPDTIYALLQAIEEEGVTVDDETNLNAVKVALDAVVAGTYLDENVKAYPVEETTVNLYDIYADYFAQYEADVQHDGGETIKAEMDAINEKMITLADEEAINNLVLRYNTWIGIAGNYLTNVEGFEATYETFNDVSVVRLNALIAAEAEAIVINADILDFAASVTNYGGTQTNKTTKDNIADAIADWVATYFAGDYADEIASDNVNYNMVDHVAFDTAVDAFEQAVADVNMAALDFIEAVKNIGTVDLLSWDEIDAAVYYYNKWVTKTDEYAGAASFDYMFNTAETPADYFKTVISSQKVLSDLQADAKAAYDAAKAYADLVDAETITLYSDNLDGIIKWYNDYCDVVEGVVTFNNPTFEGVEFTEGTTLADYIAANPAAQGYRLAKDLVITEDDYNAIMDLKAVQDALIAAKVDETANVIALIEAIGDVTISPNEDESAADEIAAARAAYDTWKNGTSAQNAVVDNCTVYVITNYQDLVDAEAELAYLENLSDDIKSAIEALEFTDPKMNPAAFNFGGVSNRVQGATLYQAELDRIADLITEFETNNNGNRGVIEDAEYADLANANLIVIKVNAYYGTINSTKVTAGNAVKNLTNVGTDAKSALDVIIADMLKSALNAVRYAETADDVAEIVALEVARFEAVADASTLYDTKLAEVAVKDDLDDPAKEILRGELEICFNEYVINKLVVAEDVLVVDDIISRAESEFDSIINSTGI